MIFYPGDRVRTVVLWGSFKDMRGEFVEMRGDRPFVRLDGDLGGVLLYSGEIVLDEPDAAGSEVGDDDLIPLLRIEGRADALAVFYAAEQVTELHLRRLLRIEDGLVRLMDRLDAVREAIRRGQQLQVEALRLAAIHGDKPR